LFFSQGRDVGWEMKLCLLLISGMPQLYLCDESMDGIVVIGVVSIPVFHVNIYIIKANTS